MTGGGEESTSSHRRRRFPRPGDPARLFAEKRGRILARVMPTSLVPLATSNAMLLLGSSSSFPGGEGGSSCYFPLPQYLVWAGAVSLSMATMGVLSRHLLLRSLRDRSVSHQEANVIVALEYLAQFMSLVQVAILLSGTVVLLPQLAELDTVDETSPLYCDRGMVIFSTVLLSMCWFFLLFAFGSYVTIRCSEEAKVRKRLPPPLVRRRSEEEDGHRS